MRIKFLVPAFLFSCGLFLNSTAQFRVSIIINDIPDKPKMSSIFFAGNINGWNPDDSGYLFKKGAEGYVLHLNKIPAGLLEFKCTGGSWETVECGEDGKDIDNRQLEVQSDTLIRISIAAWKDPFASRKKEHTVEQNVEVLDTAFKMPQLKRTRRIWVCLPPDYKTSGKRYPVLYMQDGQNLFDEATAAFGEWGIDETLNRIYHAGGPGVIVVGVDNGGVHRIREYNPFNHPEYGKGEGKLYAAFLVKTLKPYIDAHFRTKPDARHTGIAGSSMGGLISFYTWLKYPEVFGKVGVFSPSFWIAPQIKKEILLTEEQKEDKVYLIAGDAESPSLLSEVKSIYDEMLQQGMPASRIKMKTVPGGKHNEASWRKEFPKVFLWLFSDSVSSTALHGTLKGFFLPSEYVDARKVGVWLPEGYDTSKKYAVLYMQDGQNLFDASDTRSKPSWQIAKTMERLIQKDSIQKTIVVGIWNNGKKRMAEYFPQKAFNNIAAPYRDSLMVWMPGGPVGDTYLRFMVKELKPFIDSSFSVYKDRNHTFLMGSSYGSFISLYALCEYPKVFGGAACLSTHWIGLLYPNEAIPNAITKYLKQHLPDPQNHRIYFDYGSRGFDQYYKPYQKKVNKIMKQKGYSGSDWETKYFPETGHSEKSWAERASVPLEFLLGNH